MWPFSPVREERCPGTWGHRTLFGTWRCDTCGGIVEPEKSESDSYPAWRLF
jgi:hypothetical protein